MKLNRLLEITTILLNKKTTTAKELARRFNVSTRTIYRDIDALSASGVPVYTSQGTNGGISVLEDYTINRTALTSDERDSILLALQTLQSTNYPEIDAILEKLGSIFKNTVTDWISIDFAPWGANPNSCNKFNDIKTAIMKSKVIEVDYINAYNTTSRRKIEPLRLIFKSQAWYLWRFCLRKKDYRTFRISRIKEVAITDETFDRSCIHTIKEKPSDPEKGKPLTHLSLEFTGEALYRLYDDFNYNMLRDNGNGTYSLEIDFPEDEWVYGFILSFRTYVKVIGPEYIRKIICERTQKILEYYK